MLPKSARLIDSGDYVRATKSGLRVTSANFVGYLHISNSTNPARAGLIISKSVGGSVTRHRVARKIRHVLQNQIILLPTGGLLVIRALTNAATTDCADEVKSIISKLISKTTDVKTGKK